MKSAITDRMKRNREIGRVAMLRLRQGTELSREARALVITTVDSPDVGREKLEADRTDHALSAIWFLDDAEQTAVHFSQLEERAAKMNRLLGEFGFEMQPSDEKGCPFSLIPLEDEVPGMELFPVFEKSGADTLVRFAVRMPAKPELELTEETAQAEARSLALITRCLKRLNGLGLTGDERELRLAAFSVTEKNTVNKGKARRAALKKARRL